MKSEFMLAFNEITEARGLPKEVVMEALQTALVSAYRRNVGATSAQQVEAEVDAVSGQARIFVEKEVVEAVQDDRTEVLLEKARESEPDAQVGDTVMVRVETTARGFGRIAAQTAKQVILQRIREAEREAQYEEYVEREGEIINGTVQSVTPSAATIGLGRTEAILPRSQQVPGERYRPHDRVRAYVLEVRKTNRGPQIILSRSHRNMLRRLLEYEVPEIYNGQVEIKHIAREAGRRSKVAVVALQEGVDPVGACVGMRGVRIQSIVRELNDEKIDVIEWNPDQATFIAKALSPARVSGVYLDEDPENGRTAIVIVPDDQLSLAIGREGQNARLAAKLTGWRIDIKSVLEASFGAMEHIRADDPALSELAQENAELLEEIARILAKKEADRPVMPEEYKTLTRFAGMVEERLVEARRAEREERRALLAEIRATVPAGAYQLSLEALGLEAGVEEALVKAGSQNVGALMEQIALDESRLTNLEGVGPEAMETVKAALETVEIPEVEVAEAEVPEEVEEAEEAEKAEEVGEAVEAEPEPEVSAAEEEVEAPAPPAPQEPQVAPEPALATAPEPALAQGPAAPPEEYSLYEDEDRLEELEKAGVDKKRKKEKEKRRRRELVFDEALGEVVARRRRKGSRESEDWELDDLEKE
jgi:N utilization substance protein A